jgi:Uma2 family endonuclease
MGATTPLRLSRDEFRRWAAIQKGQFERVDGEVIAISPERIAHAR